MKTIQFTGTDYEIDNLKFALAENDLALKSETRVYLINIDLHESEINSFDLTDEEFMTEAERQGTVYSLQGFIDSFNGGNDISSFTDVIRII